MAVDMNAFSRDLWEAHISAVAESRKVEDTLPCNFDALIIQMPRISTKKMETICKSVGFTAHKCGTWWKILSLYGMGTRNTIAQETLARVLRSKGYEAYVEYRLD